MSSLFIDEISFYGDNVNYDILDVLAQEIRNKINQVLRELYDEKQNTNVQYGQVQTRAEAGIQKS